MTDVIAKRVDDLDADPCPGGFEFYTSSGEIAGMAYVCPCGCGLEGALGFRKEGRPRPSWEWNGNQDKPTLSPSVHHIIGGVTHWHGYLTDGVWRSC